MPWTIRESTIAHLDAEARDTVFSIGNGRFCTRGTAGEAFAATVKPYRATLVNGLFTRAGYGLDWLLVAPDWTALAMDLPGATAADDQRQLDLERGILTRTWRLRAGGAVLLCREERFASWSQPFLAAQRLTVSVEAGAAEVAVFAGVDGGVRGSPGKNYRPGQVPNCGPDGLRLSQVERALCTGGTVEVAVRARATGNGATVRGRIAQSAGPTLAARDTVRGEAAGVAFGGRLERGQVVVIDKLCALAADLDAFESRHDAPAFAATLAGRAWDDLLAEHVAALADFWRVADLRLDGDAGATLALRFAVWSTRIAAGLDGGRSSIGPKNLTGEWYRGLLFWDMDAFQAPLLAALCPERARNHLRYRHRLLPAARSLARQDGFDGARYPFSAPPSGEERPMNLNGIAGQQLHVNLAVACAIVHTWQLTGDDAVLIEDGGLEILLELARFWLSAVQGPDAAGAFHLPCVTGPDELHHKVDDNWYTNAVLAHHLRELVGLLADLARRHPADCARLRAACGFDPATEARACQVADGLFLPALPSGAPAQFAGFERQPEANCAIRNQWGIGDNTHKQADTVLVAQMLPRAVEASWLARAYDTYAPLCTQTSSLSPGSHALAAARLGRADDAERFLRLACGMELDDAWANTAHGIHGAGQGGLWIAAIHGLGGVQVDASGLAIEPHLPPCWPRLDYSLHLHGGLLRVTVTTTEVTVRREGGAPVRLTVAGTKVFLAPGEAQTLPCRRDWQGPRLRGVLFDLDGVLVSTDHCHYRAWKEAADRLGLPFSEQDNHALRGVSREESLRRILRGTELPADQFTAVCDAKNARYRELISTMTPADVLPGMLDLLRTLRARGIKVAVASASRNTGLVLERTGLAAEVDAVADGNHVTASKPDPQVFTLAAMRVRALPWECVGIEDAAAGVEAIRRAGMVAVGVGGQATAAHVCVEKPQQVTADLIERAFRQHRDLENPFREANHAKMRTELKLG